MLPGHTDFIADPFHFVFLGVFAAVLVTVVGTLGVAAVSARRAVARGNAASILWGHEVDELPSPAEECRHALTGELPGRHYDRAFDCKGLRDPREARGRGGGPAPRRHWRLLRSCGLRGQVRVP